VKLSVFRAVGAIARCASSAASWQYAFRISRYADELSGDKSLPLRHALLPLRVGLVSSVPGLAGLDPEPNFCNQPLLKLRLAGAELPPPRHARDRLVFARRKVLD
jgi:hypothetical protein